MIVSPLPTRHPLCRMPICSLGSGGPSYIFCGLGLRAQPMATSPVSMRNASRDRRDRDDVPKTPGTGRAIVHSPGEYRLPCLVHSRQLKVDEVTTLLLLLQDYPFLVGNHQDFRDQTATPIRRSHCRTGRGSVHNPLRLSRAFVSNPTSTVTAGAYFFTTSTSRF